MYVHLTHDLNAGERSEVVGKVYCARLITMTHPRISLKLGIKFVLPTLCSNVRFFFIIPSVTYQKSYYQLKLIEL